MDDVDIAMQELSKLPAKKQPQTKKKYTPPFELLTKEEVSEAIHISTNMMYRWINEENEYYDPTFPKPLKVGRFSMWRADEITAWMLGLKRREGPEAIKNGPKKTPNVKVRGPEAALSPEAPSRLPGSADGDSEKGSDK